MKNPGMVSHVPDGLLHITVALVIVRGAVRSNHPNSRSSSSLLGDRTYRSPLRWFPVSLKNAAPNADMEARPAADLNDHHMIANALALAVKRYREGHSFDVRHEDLASSRPPPGAGGAGSGFGDDR